MTPRSMATALLLVILAVVLQTTLFGRVRVFGSAPALVVLVVVAVVRHLRAEQGLLIGFTAGLLVDLLGSSPLGLWALVMTVVAYATLRIRDRFEDDFTLIAIGVFGLSFGALALFAVLGTIFGQRTLSDPGVIRKMLLPSLYNTLLAAAVVPLISRALRTRRHTGTGWEL